MNGHDLPELLTEEPEREDLLAPQDGEDMPVADFVQVTDCFRSIAWYERKKALLDAERAQLLDAYNRWFDARIAQCAQRIDLKKASLDAYMKERNLKNVATPEGTAYYRTGVTRNWPEDQTLVAWAEASGIAEQCVKVKQSPDKRALLDYITRTGEIPDGFTETSTISLQLKGLKRDPTASNKE